MTTVLSDGVCVEDILSFSTFVDSRRFASINKSWQLACRSAPAWRVVDVVGFQSNHLAVIEGLPAVTKCLKIDVESLDECIKVLELAISHPGLTNVQIFRRRNDGSVAYSKDRISKFDAETNQLSEERNKSLIDVMVQFPLEGRLLDILKDNASCVRSLSLLSGASENVSELLPLMSNMQTLMMGSFPSELDLDPLMPYLLSLRYLQAENLNISLDNLRMLKKKVRCDFGMTDFIASLLLQ